MSRGSGRSADCLAGPCEPLDKHSLEVAACVGAKGVYVAKKMTRVFGLSAEVVLDLLEFAALVHDVGKADEEYAGSSGYYPLHEARSTAFLAKALELAGLRGTRPPLGQFLRVPAIAVALHHYSHKDVVRGRAGSEVYVGFRPRCGLGWIARWSPRTDVGLALRSAALSISEIPMSQHYAEVIAFVKSLPGPEIRTAASAALGVLGACDVEAARRNRCG